MNIEKQVCSLEQAKRLNELGIDLISQFAWCWNGAYMVNGHKGFFLNLEGFEDIWEEAYPAFTVSELGVLLPDGAQLKKCPNIAQFSSFRIIPKFQKDGEKYLCSACIHDLHHVTKDGIDAHKVWEMKYGETEAESRAAMLIYLLENKHITAEQVNAAIS